MAAEKNVLLQISVPRQTRNLLKSQAALRESDMSTLGGVLLGYGLSLLTGPKVPPDLQKLIDAVEEEGED